MNSITIHSHSIWNAWRDKYANVFNAKVSLILAAFILFYPKYMSAQDELRNTLDHMFAKVTSDMVPTGCLIDYATEYTNIGKFDGNISSSPELCDVITYSHILKTFFSSSLQKDRFYRFEQGLKEAKDNAKDNHVCRLSIVFNDYAQLRSDCLEKGAIKYENEQVEITSPDAFQIKKLFAGCIIDNIKTTNNIQFYTPKELILSDCMIKDIELDWGNGMHSLVNDVVSARLADGHNVIKVAVTDSNGRKYHSYTCIDILAKEDSNLTRSSYDSTFKTEEITGSPYNGVVTKADVTVKLSYMNHTGKIQKPLIFVEGFDPRDLQPEQMGSMNYITTYYKWRNFIEQNGFDYVYVDWQEAGEYIQANAYTLIDVINKINAIKDASSAPTVLIGHSMGGLVARYALKTMENRGATHDVGTYISYDSPHMGANVPMGLLYGFHGLLKFLKDKDIIDYLVKKYTDVESWIKLGERYAYSTAAQQMLVDYIDPMGNPNNQVHNQWQTELDNLGFPNGDNGKDFKKLAIANSDYSTPSVDDKLIYCDFSAGVNIPHALSPLMSIAVGVLFQDVIAGLLTVLPGRDEINGIFECLAGKRNGQKVTNISIGYKKDFLWIVPISKTVFSYSKYYSGSCIYDLYPASYYVFGGMSATSEGGFPIILNWSSDIQVSQKFGFIPTSSALAVSSGLNNTSGIFTSIPNISNLVFDGIRMEDDEQFQNHVEISNESQDWLISQIQTSIEGPRYGLSGSRYTLSGQSSNVSWQSSDTSLATISDQGILTVNGSGVVKITATTNGNTYSKNVIVGMPKFVLTSSHIPGGYQIDASVISSEFKNYDSSVNQAITFRWGVKFTGENIRWMDSHNSSILIPLENGYDEVTIFLRLVDNNGVIKSTQSVNAQSSDIFSATNNVLSIDSNKKIYKENGSLYSYQNGKIYISRDTSLPSEYQRDIWTSTKGVVFSPFATSYSFTVTRGEIPIKQVFSEEEVDLILQNGELNQEYIYTLALLNPENKIIQFIPVTIKRI